MMGWPCEEDIKQQYNSSQTTSITITITHLVFSICQILIHSLTMSSTKLITVYGSTGSQGGSVVASLLQSKDKTFALRGITRNPESEKAMALASQGVEIVKADGFVKDQVVEAFRGSWGVFVNTNSDDPVSSKNPISKE
jgi:hypothetical protein